MIRGLIKKMFGSHQERVLRDMWPIAARINEWYEQFDALPDEAIQGKVWEFRARLQDGETLEDLLPEAFATVKQACKRQVGQRWMAADMPFEWIEVPYDVQLIGGIVLHRGRIAEMATGEGKTLVATLPLYLNALDGRGCHLATFNDMLAQRDSQWTGHILEWLGLTVGCIQQEMEPPVRRQQYASDVTYGQSSEFGFDYLRDNMTTAADHLVQGVRSKISQALADEIVPFATAEERGKVISDAFQTLLLEVSPETVPGLVTRFAGRFSLDGIRVSWRGPRAGAALPEPPPRACKIEERLEVEDVPEGVAHVRFQFFARDFHFVIVDEVDSLLIDEARTPLIIAGQVERSTQRYSAMLPLVEVLVQRQAELVKRLLSDAEDLLSRNDEESRYQAGIRLLQAKKAMPKNKRFMKLSSEPEVGRLVTKCENDFIIDQKSKMGGRGMGYVEAELFFVIDEKGHSVDLSEQGREVVSPDNPDRYLLADLVDEFSRIEGDTALSPEERETRKAALRQENEIKSEELHSISQLLRAYALYEKDVEYVVNENKVIIVDEFTGRPQPGRRYSDGLHQAIEAKEQVKVEKESQTLATITIQNYFRMYTKAAGMTGTAETEAQEFAHTYKMDVLVVPTHRPLTRVDYDDVIYRTRREKFNAIVEEVTALHKQGLPILIGTVSVDTSELLSRMLRRAGVSHNVLNAKHLHREAEIVRDAGRFGAVTIATNMAGRGTDIKLGPGVLEPPEGVEADPDRPRGLQIIGSERHEARRIDRQLRGRAGRQGDPGASQFFLSLEDDLMRLFGSERISGILQKLGLQEGEPITHRFVTHAITRAQKKIESINFEQRKRTLDYDNVMNKQRESIYGLRREVLISEDLRRLLLDVCHDFLASEAAKYLREGESKVGRSKLYDLDGFEAYVRAMVPGVDLTEIEQPEDPTEEYLDAVTERIGAAYDTRRTALGPNLALEVARHVILHGIDNEWRNHLAAIDELREGIHLRSYAQLDPLVEYQREATYMFQDMMVQVQRIVFEHFFRMNVVTEEQQTANIDYGRGGGNGSGSAVAAAAGEVGEPMPEGMTNQPDRPRKPPTYHRDQPKVGRNDPCPCGSGKKYKKCCGAGAE